MSVSSPAVRYADVAFRTVAMLCSFAALWLWTQSILQWGDAMAMASALTWTTVSLAVWGVIIAAEWVTNRGE